LPIHRGTSHGKTVWYLLTDASNEDFADEHGINLARPLANARGTAAVQKVSIKDGVIDFPATVDFSPVRKVVPSATGFPPLVAQPGAVGESNYSPLIELPNGTIANAPHIANDSGQGDKVLALDTNKRTVLYGETNGFKDGKQAHYISTDSSSPVAAAIEGVTYAPALNALLALPANTPPDSSLVAFINGQTGANNPQRQGLNSALLDGLTPNNVIETDPRQKAYSPLWDVSLAKWSDAAVAQKQNLRQTSLTAINALAAKSVLTSPDGSPLTSAGFWVNCPVVSIVGGEKE